MISALSWVRRGAAQEVPERSALTEEEYERIAQQLRLAQDDLDEAEQAAEGDDMDVEEPDSSSKTPATSKPSDKSKSASAEDELAIYKLDKYDEEDAQDGQRVSLFSNIRGLAYYSNNEEDPYVQFKDTEDDQEELEEMRINPTDNLILATKTEDDVSHLEVYVYEEAEDHLYVHHDVLLPSFPLCLEWMDYPVGRKQGKQTHGNFVAVGTFEPHVEIWDLDRIDDAFPDCILGEIPESNNNQPSGKKLKKKAGPMRVAKRSNPERHVDAVMSISWNKLQRNLVATGSADTTVKLWDLNRPSTAIANYTHHRNKVQAVAWNPTEASVLLTGGYDKKACAFDSRAPAAVASWSLSADVECMRWDPHHPERFFVSTEDGMVRVFDARAGAAGSATSSLFTLHAHDSAVSALDINPHIEGCIITGSSDKTVKIWSIRDNKPTCIVSRDVGCGKVFSANFSCDSPYLVSIAGSKGNVVVWNLEQNAGVRRVFPIRQHRQSTKESTASQDVKDASDNHDDDTTASESRKELTQLEPDDEPDSSDDENDVGDTATTAVDENMDDESIEDSGDDV